MRIVGALWVLGVAAATLALGLLVLSIDHPAEDAYILFRYAANLAGGSGIAFNPGGPQVEGATDFLWLLALGAGVRAGADVALWALVLNVLGAALIASAFTRVALRSELPRWARLTLLVPGFGVVLSHAALAAYFGFSTLLYAALSVWAAAWLCEGAPGAHPRLRLLPWLGLVLGLFRPDGVVLGVGYALMGWVPAVLSGQGAAYGRALRGAALCGVAYFSGRAFYFGEWLPLPLYVKSYTGAATAAGGWLGTLLDALPGAREHARWLRSAGTPLPTAGLLLVLLGLLSVRRPHPVGRLIAALVPSIALLGLLCLAVQSQNVSFRFQAPAELVLSLVTLVAGVALARRAPSRLGTLACVLGVVLVTTLPAAGGAYTLLNLVRADQRLYLGTFAPLLGSRLRPDDVLAVTEAGMVPYWSPAQVVDVVGLNNPETARRPPSYADLQALAPDLVLFHHAYTLDPARVVQSGAGPVQRIAPSALVAAVVPELRDAYRATPTSHEESGLLPVKSAALALTRFVGESGAYEVVLVDAAGRGRFEHVWAFRRGWSEVPRLMEWLEESARHERYTAYLDVR